MNRNWNIGFEWVVTGAAVIGVIFLLITGGEGGTPDVSDRTTQAGGDLR